MISRLFDPDIRDETGRGINDNTGSQEGAI